MTEKELKKDEAAHASKAEAKMMDIFNKGNRIYQTTAGPLRPKQSVSVPEAEAKTLMDYFDIVDLQKVAPKASAEIEKLKAENARLKAQLAEQNADPKVPEDDEVEQKHSSKGSGKGGKKGKD